MTITLNKPFANFNPQDFSIIITCADGLENALLIELDSFGVMGELIRVGRIAAKVDLARFYHICLYSRVASRVLLPIGEYHFKQKHETVNQISTDRQGRKITRTVENITLDEDITEALYHFTSRYDWSDIFNVDQTFVIRLSTDKKLTINQQFATLRIKDAIADSFNKKLGRRPDVDSKAAQVQIFATANSKFAELFIDLSGTSLHRRGYRVANTAAPLKENLAAALLYESGWHTGKHNAIIDPMCGSGTFITESLLMRADYPTGLDKATDKFGFYHWEHHDQALWEEMVHAATVRFHDNLDKMRQGLLCVIALDADAGAIHACHQNLQASGLSSLLPGITLQQRPLTQLKDVLKTVPAAAYPLIITNPPYGERLGESDFIKPLYHGLGRLTVDGLKMAGVTQADMSVLASHVEQADTLPINDPKTLRCHNGALTVYLRHGKLNLAKNTVLIEQFEKKPIHLEDAQEFINRLQKNLAHLKKQAKLHGVSNLRIYDADLPNYNVAIDLYGDKVHVQEYAPPKQIPPEVAKSRFNLVLACVREVLGVSKEDVFIKTRARQSGNDQYTKNPNSRDNKRRKMWVVEESGVYFYVNFTDYLDTGLFIDHRNMRQLVAKASRGKHVLNLFAYTCTASTHAAVHGAKSVTSVDLSANYLDWGKQNFALNGIPLEVTDAYGEPKYQFIASDVFDWIKDNTEQYDVIFIDPPTFSNSKKFQGTFDVQRDHVALINRAMNRLSTTGVLYFSNNFTRFELDDSILERYDVVHITDQTIGFDFNPKKPIHQSFKICHKHSVKSAPSDDVQIPLAKKSPKYDKESALRFETKRPTKVRVPQDKSKDKPKFNKKATFDKFDRHTNQKPIDVASEPKRAVKYKYEKIDGKLVKTAVLNEESSINTPKKYQIRQRLDKSALTLPNSPKLKKSK
ncbi:bifunctional 23S rRNA (guanine(2069)-N(7))-methyltransferase RlmK/23S rRNA (guanine(2445)-N(2))-methyltransferase RlmL [Moraxella nasovis]|uniref:bifunctional 23S rRNA (guanine(2069)-N(7))-methyltransferase RlmK/23S rRNA (guanine(2445)-N(2))-methyltransferase RlmL n=1 Tax=Moraxella nasovis TaxID=2904121 RepID=UPI001F60F3F6|nr:bifunctional 23S rRNA (guanine(2069)-N(7))-methyltransferase RlmK/23S rRNA (guanine(2445)-N(2))-methyltransferase RlmL [Moraxella nasovis]UNU73422.1 bifunctional 23S rRNA (guanine(2069)-N(7))-methyltransferase RlmK/23S rRNA (guanine(2445)-N(2))-methyltransferase RlmL [Moraxella nasovis]